MKMGVREHSLAILLIMTGSKLFEALTKFESLFITVKLTAGLDSNKYGTIQYVSPCNNDIQTKQITEITVPYPYIPEWYFPWWRHQMETFSRLSTKGLTILTSAVYHEIKWGHVYPTDLFLLKW